MTGPFDPSVFFAAFKAAGMTALAHFALPNCPTLTDVDVTLRISDEELGSGSRSRRYVIDYEFDKAPSAVENTEVSIEGHGLFRLRRNPHAPADRGGSTGFFRQVELARIDDGGDA